MRIPSRSGDTRFKPNGRTSATTETTRHLLAGSADQLYPGDDTVPGALANLDSYYTPRNDPQDQNGYQRRCRRTPQTPSASTATSIARLGLPTSASSRRARPANAQQRVQLAGNNAAGIVEREDRCADRPGAAEHHAGQQPRTAAARPKIRTAQTAVRNAPSSPSNAASFHYASGSQASSTPTRPATTAYVWDWLGEIEPDTSAQAYSSPTTCRCIDR